MSTRPPRAHIRPVATARSRARPPLSPLRCTVLILVLAYCVGFWVAVAVGLSALL